MRALAASLTPLLLLGGLRAQAPDPVAMVAQIFEESRPLAQALWRDYQEANKDPDFSGVIQDLVGWDEYETRVHAAAATRAVAGVVREDQRHRSVTGLVLMHSAMGTLGFTWLPEHGMVWIGNEERTPRDDWDDLYVRVVQGADREWRLASWPPANLERLLSGWQPHRPRLELEWWPAGAVPDQVVRSATRSLDVEVPPDRPWFQLTYKGQVIAHAGRPKEERWREFEQLLQEVILPASVPDVRGRSTEGVLIRCGASAPIGLLLAVLARLGAPEHCIPDVRVWVSDGKFPSGLDLNQRGAWGEQPEVVPLEFPSDFTISEAVEVARLLGEADDSAVAFALPWLGPGPDPVQFLRERMQELGPILRDFWIPYSQDLAGRPGSATPPDDDPSFLAMCARGAQVLAPHVSREFPRTAPRSERSELGAASVLLMPLLALGSPPPGNAWLHQGHAMNGNDLFVRVAYRNSVLPTLSPLPVAFLRLEDGTWKFCSWDRRGWPERERTLVHQPHARAYLPTEGGLQLDLHATSDRLRYQAHSLLEIEGKDPESLHAAFSEWMSTDYPYSRFSTAGSLDAVRASSAIILDAEAWAPQAALIPLVSMMNRPDCAFTELRLQVVLDDLLRPGEIVFDQALTRPGTDATRATAVRLDPSGDLQQLCDRLDPLLVADAGRIYLMLPE